MSIQFGIRFHDVEKLPFEERLKVMKAQGFSCTHIALSKAGLPEENSALTPGYALSLKKSFAKEDLDVAVLGCYLNLANPDASKLAQIQDTYLHRIRFASLLGCGVVGTETGAPNLDYHYDREACHSDEALEKFINGLKPVVSYAEKMGVIVAIEPVYKHIVWNPKRARIVLDAIASPNLQIIFDPVNLLHEDNVDHRDEILEEAMDLLGDEIAVLHLKDYQMVDGVLKSVGAGLGEMNYDRVLRFAIEKKPFIQATLEDTKPENAKQCLKYLKDVENKILNEQ